MIEHVIDRVLSAIELRRFDDLYDCFAEDIVVWHNFDGTELSRDESVAQHHAFGAGVEEWTYTNRRRTDFEGGFVEQHDLNLTLLDGSRMVVPICMVCAMREGRITRIDEYFDRGAITSVIASVLAES